MDEELIELATEETIRVDEEEIIEDDILAEDLEQDVETEESVTIIEVEAAEEIDVGFDEAVGWVGGDNTRHYSLYGRDEADQHPITAITGLREELNDIEALDVVYSNKRNQADYYLWEDEPQEPRIGYFVSACSDVNKIKMCTSDNDIFGVTVDGAGFIGAQSEVPRGIKYGLVVTTGVVHVRCESDVNVGDYVVSNNSGYAHKNNNGYKVVGRHQIDGYEYAEITLAAPINRICKLSDDVEDVNQRMDKAETNIVAAINVANAAYNKAGEIGEVSEEAIKNALEALDKANSTSEKTDNFESRLEDANELAAEAKAIANLATTSAESIRQEAVDTSNKTLANVNDLIKDLEPITTWSDPNGNTGAEYLTTYINDGLATKVEVQTVETMTDDNKSAIEKNAESFRTLVASVDKYSVGEYSQSYGLTHEQAKSILKVGMIYVPTKHSDTRSHSEIFSDTGEVNEFTPGNYYQWDGNDWIEVSNSVAFFSEEPIPSSVLTYWYVDSNEAPEGYEPYTLYMYDNNKWVKVNIFYNNPNNRIVSSISQEVDGISLEITNARGSAATLTERIDNNEATIQGVVNWTKDPDGNQYNLATIKQTADDAGASVALVVEEKDGEKVVNAASIVTAINDGDSSVVIDADHVDISGIDISLKGQTIQISADDVLGIESSNFSVDENGYINATGGTIGGWEIGTNWLQSANIHGASLHNNGIAFGIDKTNGGHTPRIIVRKWIEASPNKWDYSDSLNINGNTGDIYIKGEINATSGKFGGITISPNCIKTNPNGKGVILYGGLTGDNDWVLQVGTSGSSTPFYVTNAGYLHATDAYITGTINASSGSFERDVKIGNRSISNWITDGGYIKEIKATTGTVGGWNINSNMIYWHDPNKIASGINLGYNTVSVPLASGIIPYGGQTNWVGIVGAGHQYNQGSDRTVKNSIEEFSFEYDKLFDGLKPCRFKYNYENNGIYHSGFIAQEMHEAIIGAGLNNKDFAAYMELEVPLANGSKYRVQKDEIVALNTWQIQKAKARISELEERVAQLEELIKEK